MPLTPRDGLALVSAALAAMALGAAAWFGLGGGIDAGESPPAHAAATEPPLLLASEPGPSPSTGDELLVDVQGGVQRPGLVRLAPGARVADAIRAAGGYSAAADLLAAANGVNLAATLADGQQVFVPLLGVAGGDGGGDGSAAGGLVNLNTASPEALEALPGIGPVTVQKIVAARSEQPFSTLDELVDRKVMNRGQLDGIRDLVTL